MHGVPMSSGSTSAPLVSIEHISRFTTFCLEPLAVLDLLASAIACV